MCAGIVRVGGCAGLEGSSAADMGVDYGKVRQGEITSSHVLHRLSGEALANVIS